MTLSQMFVYLIVIYIDLKFMILKRTEELFDKFDWFPFFASSRLI